MTLYRRKQDVQAVQYDGTPESVRAINALRPTPIARRRVTLGGVRYFVDDTALDPGDWVTFDPFVSGAVEHLVDEHFQRLYEAAP